MNNRILRLIVEIRFPTNYDYKNLSEFMNKIKHPFVTSELNIIDKSETKNITNQTFSEVNYTVKYPGTENICKMLDSTLKDN